LKNALPSDRPGFIDALPQHVAVGPPNDRSGRRLMLDARIQPARIPWAYPPLAAAQVGRHWRVAWLAPNGVWAVESSDLDPGTARPILNAPLIGEPDVMKVQFSHDGHFLVLQWQRRQPPVDVRIWDLRPAWRAWIEDQTTAEKNLRRVACRVVRADAHDGCFSNAEAELFQIDPAYQEPCPNPQRGE
jgi:hypothetical protein